MLVYKNDELSIMAQYKGESILGWKEADGKCCADTEGQGACSKCDQPVPVKGWKYYLITHVRCNGKLRVFHVDLRFATGESLNTMLSGKLTNRFVDGYHIENYQSFKVYQDMLSGLGYDLPQNLLGKLHEMVDRELDMLDDPLMKLPEAPLPYAREED